MHVYRARVNGRQYYTACDTEYQLQKQVAPFKGIIVRQGARFRENTDFPAQVCPFLRDLQFRSVHADGIGLRHALTPGLTKPTKAPFTKTLYQTESWDREAEQLLISEDYGASAAYHTH